MSKLIRIERPHLAQAFALGETTIIMPLLEKAKEDVHVREKIATAILEIIKAMQQDSYVLLAVGEVENKELLQSIVAILCQNYTILVDGSSMHSQEEIMGQKTDILSPQLQNRDVLLIVDELKKDQSLERLTQKLDIHGVKSISLIAIARQD